MGKKIFLASEIKQGKKGESFFHVIPVPYEKTVSYGSGTGLGPEAIIKASDQLENWDGLSQPSSWGIYTYNPFDCRGKDYDVLIRLAEKIRHITASGCLPITLGGEHTVSYAGVMGVSKAFSDEKIGIIHFDAHADLRDRYEGSMWSHACVMKRLLDEGMSLIQLGIRAYSLEEKQIRAQHADKILCYDARAICRQQPVHQINLPDDFPEKVYISVDIDGLDSAVMPATGTPVPGGLTWWQLLDLIEHFSMQRRVVGMDVVEFAPIKGMHAYDYMCAELVHRMMGYVQRSPLTVNTLL